MIANNIDSALTFGRFTLRFADASHRLIGTQSMETLSTLARKLSGNRLPQWNPFLPVPASSISFESTNSNERKSNERDGMLNVVYVPSCTARLMGPARGNNPSTYFPQKYIYLFVALIIGMKD